MKDGAFRWWWRAMGTVALAGCGLTDSSSKSTITLDFRGISPALIGTPFASILSAAKLTISSDGDDKVYRHRLGDNAVTTTFDVSVPPGNARFALEISSDNGTVLYRADTTEFIDGDGFVVNLVARAVSPVMVVTPRNPEHSDNAGDDVYVTWDLYNVGIDSLIWNIDSAASDGALGCYDPIVQDCFRPVRGTLSDGPTTVLVRFNEATRRNRYVTFNSNAGRVTFDITLP